MPGPLALVVKNGFGVVFLDFEGVLLDSGVVCFGVVVLGLLVDVDLVVVVVVSVVITL